jgi:hypothetical protein
MHASRDGAETAFLFQALEYVQSSVSDFSDKFHVTDHVKFDVDHVPAHSYSLHDGDLD